MDVLAALYDRIGNKKTQAFNFRKTCLGFLFIYLLFKLMSAVVLYNAPTDGFAKTSIFNSNSFHADRIALV